MSIPPKFSSRWILPLLLGALSAACGDVGYKDKLFDSTRDSAAKPDAGAQADAGTAPPADVSCPPALASEKLNPRVNVLGGRKQAAGSMFTRDLFNLFQSHCRGCHVEQGLGGFQVGPQNFSQKVTRDVLARIKSDDPELFMPPLSAGGKAFSQRGPADPVVQLAALLDAWLAAGSPPDVFFPAAAGGAGSQKPFLLSTEVGMAMTNLGNCIPAARMVGSEAEKSSALDKMFADASELPNRLEETDLFSLDSEVLARHGMVAFAPAYTLWADNAKKIRMLRVPVGTSIRFDAATQSFDIPPNTRVYKTFLKRVVDYRGNESYRKMETRLIVSRPDVQREDGSFEPAALFGTYVWNDAETEAVLVRDPLRNGQPFRDRLINYITDEQAADALLAKGPDNVQEELESRGILRTYAVPGAARCVHCHMGAPNKSFILGITPLQLLRRPESEGGVIEGAERDELNQLQRLIDYGVITGMSSPDEVVLLENSQGERKPRNEHELKAQGYMMGNCAHCHNPRGFPSVTAPELRDVLNFWPGPDGGIFQFPLDKTSPRVKRGTGQVPMPYISPSLYDLPVRNGDVAASASLAKSISKPTCKPADGKLNNCIEYVPAPWKSLIYRNVDAPFAYAEDSVIFPHMPMDTPGYDCRARHLIGSWMLSIPSRWKHEKLQIGIPESELPDAPVGTTKVIWSTLTETLTVEDRELRISEDVKVKPELLLSDPQQHMEAFPGEASYPLRVASGERRVKAFLEGPRGNDCPDPSLNVVDPKVVSGERVVPGPTILWPLRDSSGEPLLQSDGALVGTYSLAVPERAHWADTDLTEAGGDWYPRRSDWADVLVKQVPVKGTDPVRVKDQMRLIELLQTMKVTPAFKDEFALKKVPFGFWKEKDGCDFSSEERSAAFTGERRPRWLAKEERTGTEPVYLLSPGAMVFNGICVNCHGPRADSQSRLATTIADLTGGFTRVANLRDGLFGPPGMPGTNVERIFGKEAKGDITARDWAARYVLWMGLGGTGSKIPGAALSQIKNAEVLGTPRRAGLPEASDANMLTVARQLCASLMQKAGWSFSLKEQAFRSTQSPLAFENGDAEVWMQLCSFDNPAHVQVVRFDQEKNTLSAGTTTTTNGALYARDRYPAELWVGDPKNGPTQGVRADNPAPWCIDNPREAAGRAKLASYWSANSGSSISEIPLCPEDQGGYFVVADEPGLRWTTRGALNAGLAAFVYLEAITKDSTQAEVAYDQCEKRQAK